MADSESTKIVPTKDFGGKELPSSEKVLSRKEVAEYIATIAEKLVVNKHAPLPSLLALDSLMRLPNAVDLFDEDLKGQAKDLWLKLKSVGVELIEPPVLFGIKEGEIEEIDENILNTSEDEDVVLDMNEFNDSEQEQQKPVSKSTKKKKEDPKSQGPTGAESIN